MSILNPKKKKVVAAKPALAAKTKKLVVAGTAGKTGVTTSRADVHGIIIRPRVTEKVALISESGKNSVVMFEVSSKANKSSVSEAIKALYKVVPVKVAVLKVPPKKSFVRGRVSYGATKYKAYVYLKSGDKIEVI